MLGSGARVNQAPTPPMEPPPRPYAIIRSDSSDIRLFFFWTRYSSWFIHFVFWSAGLPVGWRGVCEWGTDRPPASASHGGHGAHSTLALLSSSRSNFSSLMPCCSSSRNVTSISSNRLWMACEGRAALARGPAPHGTRPPAAGWRGRGWHWTGDAALPHVVTWALQNLFICASLARRVSVRFQVGYFSSPPRSRHCKGMGAQVAGQSMHRAPPALAATAEPDPVPWGEETLARAPATSPAGGATAAQGKCSLILP